MVPVGVAIVAIGIGAALVAQWAVQNHRLQGSQFSLTCLSLYAAATLPNIAERSLHPDVQTAPTIHEFINCDSPGATSKIGLVLTGCLLWLSTVVTLVLGLMMRQPLSAIAVACATACFAYMFGTSSPLADLRIAFGDRQTTTLTEEGIHFHFPPLLSIEEHKRNTEVWVHWKDHLAIGLGRRREHFVFR